jgi:hypothetical protein
MLDWCISWYWLGVTVILSGLLGRWTAGVGRPKSALNPLELRTTRDLDPNRWRHGAHG